MPVTTPQQKINRTKAFGGSNVEIRLFGDYFDQTLKEAVEFAKRNEGVFIPPFDNENVIEGQATVMSEVTDQMPEGKKPDIVLLAVGGGGLAAGMVKYSKLNAKVKEEERRNKKKNVDFMTEVILMLPPFFS